MFHGLAYQRESQIEEGWLTVDHVHILMTIPPRYVVPEVIGNIKGKSPIHIARVFEERKRNCIG